MGVVTHRAQLWTEAEDATIRSLWHNHTDRQIGEELGRPEMGVTSRRLKIGCLRVSERPKTPGMRNWSAEDDAILRQCFAAEIGDEEIAITLGRTIGSVRQRRSALGLRRKEQPEHLKTAATWDDGADQVLQWMFRRGKSDQEIGVAMDRTPTAIKDRRQSLGLWRDGR